MVAAWGRPAEGEGALRTLTLADMASTAVFRNLSQKSVGPTEIIQRKERREREGLQAASGGWSTCRLDQFGSAASLPKADIVSWEYTVRIKTG